MSLLEALTFSLFLLYYWYFYFSHSKPLPEPQNIEESTILKDYHPQLLSTQPNHFQFQLNNVILWDHEIPESYTFHQNQLIQQDECHSMPDGTQVLAKGFTLYKYLKENPLYDDVTQFKENADSVHQQGDIFYFTCQSNRIHRLHICPSGQTFFHGMCQSLQSCTGQPDGTRFHYKNQLSKYIQCRDEKEYIETCPDETFFLLDTCRPKNDLIHYCNFFDTSFLLDSKTKVECKKGKVVYTTCPDGYQFFEGMDECEPQICSGKPDGLKIPFTEERNGPFLYHSGYYTCQDQRIAEAIECPKLFDAYLTRGDNLSHLPMVFDGERCNIPEICTNVTPVDPTSTIVPVHEFSKYILNWKDAEYYDSFSGYQCTGTKRVRVDVRPGERIKRFKRDTACDDGKLFVPIGGEPDQYFDCTSQSIQSCPPDEQFNGIACSPKLSHPFKFNDMGLFQFNSLSHDNWMNPWKTLRTPSSVQNNCTESESEYLSIFNICSHPDCVPYAFLMHLPSLSMFLPDKISKCVLDQHLLKKETMNYTQNHFWSQRFVGYYIPTDEETCVPGSKLQTGNFVWDSTIYATCDLNQPFVFCPSSDTDGLIHVDGKRFACKPSSKILGPSEFFSMEPTLFETNEIKSIHPLDPSIPDQTMTINQNPTILPTGGYVHPKKTILNLSVDQPVLLDYRYRITHPPDVYFEESQPKIGYRDGAFIMRHEFVTQRPIEIPTYDYQSNFPNFTDTISNKDE